MNKPFDPRDLPGVHFTDVRRVEITSPDGSTKVVHRGLVNREDLTKRRTKVASGEDTPLPSPEP